MYRSPGQIDDKLETFWSDLSFLLNNINKFQPSCLVLLGDFNAKHSKWCSTDKKNKSGIALENMTSTAGYNQNINKSTHFINISSSYIDLIFDKYLIKIFDYDKYHHNTTHG